MDKKIKIRCRNCSHVLFVEEGGTVCDKCFAFNEYVKTTERVNEKSYREAIGKRKVSKLGKAIITGALLGAVYFGISSIYVSKINEVKNLSTVGQITSKVFEGTIDSKDFSLSIVETGFVEDIENKEEQRLFYIFYDLDLNNRYTFVEYTPYIKLEAGDYIKPLLSYDLEEAFGITEQEQFKYSINNRIEDNRPKGILMFKVEKGDKPIQIQINETDMEHEYYIDILNNIYIMDLEI